jgi:acyl-[acyl-carrier-protein]-phospholipid O-acyltransferase/long-chain-fatty-acid--[acyl-carrier-protein] ligase
MARLLFNSVIDHTKTTINKDRNMSSVNINKFSPSFYALTGAQFFGAFNDNMFKLLVIFQLVALFGTDKIVSVSALAGAIFVVPFLLFSSVGGFLADRYSKRTIFHWLKIAEIVIMAIGSVGFIVQNPILLYTTLFLMATQSALLGPAKTGLVPEIVSEKALTRANSIMVSSTFMSIILGTGAAAVLSMLTASAYQLVSIGCIIVAIAGAICSYNIKDTGRRSDNQSSVKGYRQAINDICSARPLLYSIIGSSLFLFIGAFVQLSIIPYGMTILSLSRELASYLFVFAAIGIGAGSTVSGLLSRHRPELGIIPISSVGLGICAFLISILGTSTVAVSVLMVLLGFFGGMFIVPIQTLIQQQAPSERRGAILAINSTLDFTGILFASAVLWLLDLTGVQVKSYFDVVGFLSVAIALVSFPILLLPTLRMLPHIVIRIIYRLKVSGREHILENKGALIVFNHRSWIDALVVAAASPRPIRFLMARNLYELWFLKPLVKLCNVIPISYADGPHALSNSLEKAREALRNGELVGIFPEGKIITDGFMGRVKSGYMRIIDGTDADVIPCWINGIWGSNFSYYGGKLFFSLLHLPRTTMDVRFGASVSREDSHKSWKVQRTLEELGSQCISDIITGEDSLGRRFITTARKNWFHTVISDTTGKQMTFGKALTASLLFADYCRRSHSSESMIGVMLPSTVGGALINAGITLSGKVPVNLNFTVASASFSSAINQCKIKAVITSKQFLHKLNRQDLEANWVFIEDIIKGFSAREKVAAAFRARFSRISDILIEKKSRDSSQMCATVIFSSGTTSEPKGIVLTHKNIIADIESMQLVMAFGKKDTICAALPFFHSFGFTVTMWYPLIKGCAATYHTNPLDGNTIAKMVKDKKGTVLLATPTFLRTYLRTASKESFESLRMVVTGAEKLSSSLAKSFKDKFGIIPLEGYGTTECSPVVSLNVPDSTIGGFFNTGNKQGTIGRTLPGIVAKIVDPDTYEERGYDTEGLLFIKGANVMNGYLDNINATLQVLKDGWYNTGDIASIDQDGFITLCGRLSRFSKIGGEMVSHGAIEELLQERCGNDERCVAVTSVPDERKGEKLVVVHTVNEHQLRQILSDSDLPNLWKPDCFIQVASLPFTGSGKLDIKAVQKIAQEEEMQRNRESVAA